MKTLEEGFYWILVIILISIILSGCISTNPAQWSNQNLLLNNIEEDINICREKAWDESKYIFLVIGPITGSVYRVKGYNGCMRERGWVKIDE